MKFILLFLCFVTVACLPQFEGISPYEPIYQGFDENGNHVNYYYDSHRSCIFCEDCRGNHHSFFIPEVELVDPAKDLALLAQKIHEAGITCYRKVRAVITNWCSAMRSYAEYIRARMRVFGEKIRETAAKVHEKIQTPFYRRSCRCKCHSWNANHVHGPHCHFYQHHSLTHYYPK